MVDPYRRAATALIDLSSALVAAREVRYERPDYETEERVRTNTPGEPADPTFVVVTDDIRWEVSDLVTQTDKALFVIALTVETLTRRLNKALRRWHNEPSE